MAYSTLNDLLASLPEETVIELSDDSEEPASVDEDIVNELIEKADNRINGYLRGRYDIPLDPVPDEIKDMSVDLTAYFLYSRRATGKGVPKEIEDKYRDAIKLLTDIQAGRFTLDATRLGASSGDTITGSGDVRINKASTDRIFTKELFSGF